MTESTHEQLLGYLLGALDEPEQNAIQSRMSSEPQLRHEAALLRQRLTPLESLRCEFAAPAGLAERTCRLVASRAEASRPAALRTVLPAAIAAASLPHPRTDGPAMTPVVAPPTWISRIRWLDVAMAAGIFIAAFSLTIPAIQHSRSNARVTACQDNLRQLGQSLTRYSEKHDGYFPRIPTEGNMAVAGAYAPTLLQDRLLNDVRLVVCPGSSLADQPQYRVPSPAELQKASPDTLRRLRESMGGSYGYNLGYMRDGTYHATRNQYRPHFALMADAPSVSRSDRQSVNHDSRGQNVLYEDGHVSFESSSVPTPTADNIFANDDGAMSAGVHINDSVVGPSAVPPVVFVGNPR